MKPLILLAVALNLLLLLSQNACAGTPINHPHMERGLKILEATLENMKQHPADGGDAKKNLLSNLDSAREAIADARGAYKGHRSKAVEFIKEAGSAMTSDETKAETYIRKAIFEIREGIRVAK